MEIYIINLTILTAAGLLAELVFDSKLSRSIYCIYAWLQLTIIAAVRFSTGIDYNQYYNTYYEISRANSWGDLLQRREEIGYIICNRLVSYITDNIILFLLFYYGIMFGLLLWYIYVYAEIKWIAVISFIAFDFYAMSFCFMRQAMAIVIGLYVLEMIKQRRSIAAVILTAIAMLFHVSALFLLICLAVSYIPWQSKKTQAVCIGLGITAYFGCDILLQHILVGPFARYIHYLDSQFMIGNQIFIISHSVLCFVLVFVMQKMLCEKDWEFERLLPILFLGVVLSILSTRHYIIERMALYITIYNIQICSKVLTLFKKREDRWNFGLAVISSLVIGSSAFAFGLHNDRYGIIPYGISEYYLYDCGWLK